MSKPSARSWRARRGDGPGVSGGLQPQMPGQRGSNGRGISVGRSGSTANNGRRHSISGEQGMEKSSCLTQGIRFLQITARVRPGRCRWFEQRFLNDFSASFAGRTVSIDSAIQAALDQALPPASSAPAGLPSVSGLGDSRQPGGWSAAATRAGLMVNRRGPRPPEKIRAGPSWAAPASVARIR